MSKLSSLFLPVGTVALMGVAGNVSADATPPVPLPTGTLHVSSPADLPATEFAIAFCATDATGRIISGGCRIDLEEIHETDQDIGLTPGTYWLSAGGSLDFAVVNSGQTTTVSMLEITVPIPAKEVEVALYDDSTAPGMQDLLLKGDYVGNADSLNSYCADDQTLPAILAACQASQSPDYHALLGSIMIFNPDNTISYLENDGSFSKPVPAPRVSVQVDLTGPMTKYLPVFPGTYSLVYTDPLSGEKTVESGIKPQ